TWMWILVGAIVVVGGYFAFSKNKAADMNGTSNQGEQAQVPSEAGKKMAFSDFVKQGGSYKCTVTQDVNGTQTQGTTYLSGGMMRGDFSTQAQGTNMTMTMIVRDGY